MGEIHSKISDQDRIKIYKRVTLGELRTQGKKIRNEIILESPVSVNFSISDIYNYDARWYTGSSEIKKLNYETTGFQQLCYLIDAKLFHTPDEINDENLKIGLSKKQYDSLYSVL